MRKETKKREHKSELKMVEKPDGKKYVEDDRFEYASTDVKKLLRYRSKTISNLENVWHKKCN